MRGTKRYYWEITEDGHSKACGELLKARPLWRQTEKRDHIFLMDVVSQVGAVPDRPYRVSYTSPDICKARERPEYYGRRVYRCRVR